MKLTPEQIIDLCAVSGVLLYVDVRQTKQAVYHSHTIYEITTIDTVRHFSWDSVPCSNRYKVAINDEGKGWAFAESKVSLERAMNLAWNKHIKRGETR
jgi:hypothetical protein